MISYLEHENAARFLIENQADPNVGSHMNDSALILAISKRNHRLNVEKPTELLYILVLQKSEYNIDCDRLFVIYRVR